jgi:hypothetical protein
MPEKLTSLLVTSGVPSSVIDDALRRQVLAGGAIDTALFEGGALITEEYMLRFLVQASGLGGVRAEVLLHADIDLARLLPAKLAERHCLIPLKSIGRMLQVAVAFPPKPAMLEEIGFLLGRDLVPYVAIEARLREAIARCYRVPLPARYEALLATLGSTAAEPEPEPQAEPATAAGLPAAQPAPAPGVAALPSPLPPAPTAPAAPAAAQQVARAPAAPVSPPQPKKAPEKAPHTAPRATRTAPRDHVEVEGLAQRLLKESGGKPALDAEPLETWSLAKAKQALDAAEDRKQIIAVALRFALKTFDFAAAFAVVSGNAVGWSAQSRQGPADERVERISVPLHVPSVMKTVLLSRGRYLGPLPADPLSRSLVADMGRPVPQSAFFCPVEVRERPVAILYGDVLDRPASEGRVAELVLLSRHLGRRLERLILEQKRQAGKARAPAKPAAATRAANPPAFALQPPTISNTAAELFARSPLRTADCAARFEEPRGAVAPMPAPGVSRISPRMGAKAGARVFSPPPSMQQMFEAADRLVGPELTERAKAMAELARAPEIAAAVLVARFPGPLLRARLPVTGLPTPEELGPVPGALARLEAPAAQALVPLLESRDTDIRYFALLTAGGLPSPVLVAPTGAHVFDHHPLVANAARVALAAMKSVQGFDEAAAHVRAALSSRDADTAGLAIRALALLHDVESIQRLIEMTGGPNRPLAEIAADALREICKQSLGADKGRWSTWWKRNRKRPRPAWLIDALRHRDLQLRVSAIDELVEIANDSLGYEADGPAHEREAATARWVEWWARTSATVS